MRPPKQDSHIRKAKGIDHELFAIEVGFNKVMFFPKSGKGSHYTLHFGVRPGILDLHETLIDPDGTKRHKTLFAMRQSDLEKFQTNLGRSTAERLSGIIRKLRVGWMHHRKIGLVVGLIPTDHQLSTVTKLGKRKRLLLDEQAFLNNIRAPEFLEEIFDEQDGVFTIVSLKRDKPKQIGFGYKITDPKGDGHLFWIKRVDLATAMQYVQNQILQMAGHYAIPEENYSKHGL